MSAVATSRTSPGRLEELGRTRDCACFAWKNVTVTVYSGQATLETVSMLVRVGTIMRDRYDRRSAVSFVLDRVPPPSDEAREPFSQLVHGAASAICAMSTILEGTGFWASTLRSVIVGMKLEAGGSAALEVHNDVEQAVRWLPAVHYERTGVAIDPSELESMLRLARASALEEH
jgi:hypothetical protein